MTFRSELIFVKQLGLRILGLLFVWMVCRLGFYGFNASLLPVSSIGGFLKMLFFGMRFDLAAIGYVNSVLILSYILPFSFRKNKNYRNIQKWIFILVNSFALIFEVADMAYFQFSFRRAIGTDLNLVGETANMTGQFIVDFWHFIIFYGVMIFLLLFIHKKTTIAYEFHSPNSQLTWWMQCLIFPIMVVFTIIAIRGGIQPRPVMSLTTAEYVDDMRLMPLQTNTTLNLLFSVQQNFIEEKKYMTKVEQQSLIDIYKHPTPEESFIKENVFIIVLESFGKEAIGFFNNYENSATPFLDSLMLESYYFENAYAAGTRSTQGIAAITTSVPALMEMALNFSPYQSNRVESIAAHLGKKGYTSGFFHGSNPGSMEFERFSKMTGYQNFYDRTAYPDQNDYDGNWGIWDAPFFQFALQEVDKYKPPFTALLFSINAHHPYNTEAFFEKKYPDEDQVSRSVRYADYALSAFFEKAKTMDWYENTLFVITADHIGVSSKDEYRTSVGNHQIPLLLFKPNSNLKGKNTHVVQQIDILPTILDYLHFDQPYMAFGESALDTLKERYAYTYNGGIYQIISDSLILSYNQIETISMYDYKKDVLLKNDIKDHSGNKKVVAKLENQLKAMIQVHHEAMVKNRLVAE